MDNVSIKDDSNRSHFSMIPHILFEIGLKSIQLAVYMVIKRSAGENSSCTRSQETIAKQAGISCRYAREIIKELCEINPILKKPLLYRFSRITESGDNDTDLIEIVDIWKENEEMFSKKIIGGELRSPRGEYSSGGGEHSSPPGERSSGGVGNTVPEGGEHSSYKEEPFKKTPFRKTATPTPSKGAAVVHKKITKQEEEQAFAMKKLLDRYAENGSTGGNGSKNHEGWGDKWRIPINVLECLNMKYEWPYLNDQVHHMINKQTQSEKDLYVSNKKNPTSPIDKPENFLKSACNENYASSKYKQLKDK